MKRDLKSFGVMCPEDCRINDKWKKIIAEGNRLLRDSKYKIVGDLIGDYYGVHKTQKLFDIGTKDSFKKILTIDEAYDYLFGNTFVKGDLVRDSEGNIYTFETMLSDNLCNENCVVMSQETKFLVAGFLFKHTSELTKLPTRIQEIDEEIKKLEAERKTLL